MRLLHNSWRNGVRWSSVFRLCAGFSMLTALLLQGCKTATGEHAALPKSGRCVVIAEKTFFYHYGPAQTSGPDLSLSKGQQLTLLKREFGFSPVQLDDG